MKQIELSKELIEIAAAKSEAGQLVYINTKNFKIIKAEELTEEEVSEHLLPIIPMNSKDYFELMKNFGCIIDDLEFRAILYDLLTREHPFSRFREFIDLSPYRQQWYSYRRKKYIEWVEKQISDYNLLGRIIK